MTTRSADECEMSRSCHSATFSRPTSAAPRTTRARPQIRSATIGLRLCGIADEPFCPRPNGSSHLAHLRAREVPDLERERLERGGGRARGRRAARRAGRAGGSASRSAPARGRAARTRSARPPGRWRRTCRPPRRACRRACPRARARGAARARSSSNAQPASLSPKVVGSAWTPCVRPICRRQPVLLGARDDGGEGPVEPREDEAARRPGSGARARCRRRRRR